MRPEEPSDITIGNVTLLTTVKEKMEQYSQRQFLNAHISRELFSKVGYPTDKDLTMTLEMVLLCNFPVTPVDLKNAWDIFGPRIHALEGKTTRVDPDMVKTSKGVRRFRIT